MGILYDTSILWAFRVIFSFMGTVSSPSFWPWETDDQTSVCGKSTQVISQWSLLRPIPLEIFSFPMFCHPFSIQRIFKSGVPWYANSLFFYWMCMQIGEENHQVSYGFLINRCRQELAECLGQCALSKSVWLTGTCSAFDGCRILKCFMHFYVRIAQI